MFDASIEFLQRQADDEAALSAAEERNYSRLAETAKDATKDAAVARFLEREKLVEASLGPHHLPPRQVHTVSHPRLLHT